jgi:hypothetical protein
VFRTSTRKASSIDTTSFVVSIELPLRPIQSAARGGLGLASSSNVMTGRGRQLGLTVQTSIASNSGDASLRALNRRPSLPLVDNDLQRTSGTGSLSLSCAIADDTAFVLRGAACICNSDE